MLESIISYLFTIIENLGYSGIVFVMALESFFAPIPSEAILPFAGSLAYKGVFNLLLLILAAGFGSYIGSLPFYYVGKLGNKEKLLKIVEKYGKYLLIFPDDVENGFKMFDKHGAKIVFFGRLIPLVRTVVAFPAGVYHMNFWQYSAYTLLGSSIWSAIQILIGYAAGDNVDKFIDFLGYYEKIVLGIIAGIVIYIVYKRIQKIRTKA
jgi:membrane protein DedA with SNARE-associated domain